MIFWRIISAKADRRNNSGHKLLIYFSNFPAKINSVALKRSTNVGYYPTNCAESQIKRTSQIHISDLRPTMLKLKKKKSNIKVHSKAAIYATRYFNSVSFCVRLQQNKELPEVKIAKHEGKRTAPTVGLLSQRRKRFLRQGVHSVPCYFRTLQTRAAFFLRSIVLLSQIAEGVRPVFSL